MIRSNVRYRQGTLATVLLFSMLLSGGCAEKGEDPDRLIADARQARAEGNHTTAVIHLKNLLEASPEHAEGRFLLGASYGDTNNFPSAERELRKALELQYDQNEVLPLLGKALLMTGQFQQVLDEVSIHEDASGRERAEVLTLHALASMGLNRNDEARALLAQALAIEPEFTDALLGQARLAAGENKLNDATRLIDRALASAPENVDAWSMKGELDRAMGRPQDAIVAFKKVLELSPRNIPARVTLASLEIGVGDLDDARAQIEQIRNTNPNSPMANYVEGLIEFHDQNYAAARDAVLKVLEVAPDHMPSVLLGGAIEFARESHSQAQSYLSRVIRDAPNNLYACRLLAASLAKTGQPDRALEVIEKGLNQFPQDGPLMALAGEVYLQKNDFATAAVFFEKAAKLNPDSARARTQLGLARLASGQTDYALADLESASQLDFEQYQADILLVTSLLRQQKYDKALNAMQMLEKKQPNNPLTYNLKAAIYIGKKDIATARRHLEHALELEAAYVPAATNLARLDLQDGDPQAARRRFETILEQDKSNVQALLTLASFGARFGATSEEQLAWLQRARDANPDSVQPHLMLAGFYAQDGEVNKALEAAQQAQAISPDNFQVLDTLGAMQMGAGQKEQSLQTYHKLVTLQPDSPAALYSLANAELAVGNQTAAARTLKKALALKPDFIDAQVALAILEIRAGRIQEAMKIARQVQIQTADSPRGFALEGDALMAQKKFTQAAAAYETAYGIAKSGALVMRVHAAYTRAGKPNEANKRLAQWLEQSPDDPRVRLYAADITLKSGKYRTAIEHYEWLLKTQPDNVVVLNNIAWAYQQVGDTRAALESAERAQKLRPDNAAVADTLGWMLVEQGHTERGLELLQSAVAAAPEAHEIRYHLAQAWLRAGENSKAHAELEQLLATDANFPQQGEAMKLLEQLNN